MPASETTFQSANKALENGRPGGRGVGEEAASEEEVEETGKEQDVISVSSGSVKSDVPMIIE